MPTVLLVIPQGFAARYLLRTGVLSGLLAAGARVVVLAPNADEPYLRAELDRAGVALEPLRGGDDFAKRSKLWWLLFHLRTWSLGNATTSPAFLSKYAGFRHRTRRDYPLVTACIHVAVQVLWRSRSARRALLAVESRLFAEDLHADVFDRHRPDVVLTTGLGYAMADALVLREAGRRGIPTATAIAGWDNPSSKGYRGASVDRVFAWSEPMAEQLVSFQDMPRDRIAVEGVAHFDRYVTPDALWTRDELCEHTGLDPARRIVLFATSTPGAYAHNVPLVRGLIRALDDGRFGEAQLVVRMHPIHFRAGHSPLLDELRELMDGHPHVHLDVPDVVSERLRCDLDDGDNLRFSSLIAHCDVLACVFSTTALEALLSDRPVVLTSWSAHAEPDAAATLQPDGLAQRPWDEFVHLRPLLDAGAARVADSMPEVVDEIAAALADPARGREARQAYVRRECGPTDGHAGERIAAGTLALAGAPAGRPQAPVAASPV